MMLMLCWWCWWSWWRRWRCEHEIWYLQFTAAFIFFVVCFCFSISHKIVVFMQRWGLLCVTALDYSHAMAISRCNEHLRQPMNKKQHNRIPLLWNGSTLLHKRKKFLESILSHSNAWEHAPHTHTHKQYTSTAPSLDGNSNEMNLL